MRLQKLINEVYEIVYGIFHNMGHLYRFFIFIIPFLAIALYFVFVFDYLSPEQANKYAVVTLAYFSHPSEKK